MLYRFRAMTSYLRRLLRTGAAYQLADAVSKVVALALLPVYTRHLTRADYGTAELLLTTIILFSIVLRLGLGEALVRFHYLDADPERRRRLARTATGTLLVATTVAAVAVALAAEPVSRALLGSSQPDVMRAAALGLWAFTNLELAYALLRVEERARAFATASLANVGADRRADGLARRRPRRGRARPAARQLRRLGGRAGRPVVARARRVRPAPGRDRARPARPDAALRAADRARRGLGLRAVLHRPASGSTASRAPDEAGLYSLSVKLAGVVVFTVRAFQYAWPPLAYSIVDDAEASRVYARIATYYVLFTGIVVAGLVLLGRWLVRLFAAPEFFEAHEALPWVALGWALYGLFLVLVAMAGRARVTVRNAPAALCGLAVNVALLALLVPPLGIAGAGLALVGAYVVMLVVMWALTRNLFPVAFEWGRLARFALVAGGAAAGELLLPTEGAAGFLTRALALAAIGPALWAAGFFRPGELAAARRLFTRAVPNRAVELLRALGETLAAAREERRAGVLGVALRVVPGQDERGGRAQRVGPGGELAHERGRQAEWCLRM